MRGVKRTEPLFILCQRDGCGNYLQVRCPADQRKRKYCSRRCASLVNRNVLKGMTRGVARSVNERRRRLLERVMSLTPLEAFRLGYKRGLYSKVTQIRKRYVLVKKETAA